MDRLAEIAEYNSAFRNALTDEDFLAAGYTPEEISAYRGQVTAPSLTDQDRAAMLSQYGTMERPGSQYEAPQGGYADIYRDSFLARNRDQTPTSVGRAPSAAGTGFLSAVHQRHELSCHWSSA